jgi:hypothetical protein
MIFCSHCQQPIPEGALACRECHTPVDHSAITTGKIQASMSEMFVVGGINWSGVILGALIALAIWNGGMHLLVWLLGPDMIWFAIMVKVAAVFAGSFFAGYRSYSAELTHGLLVACLIGAVNGALLVFLLGAELTITLVVVDFVFIDLGAALAGAFFGARAQH